MSLDAFSENISAVGNLIESSTNKEGTGDPSEELVGELVDAYTLNMSDEELLELRDEWEAKSAPYTEKIKVRQERNKAYYQGLQKEGMLSSDIPVGSNLLFESQETFIPQALAKNPEPVVFSDNTEEGKSQSDDVKTMLQYHSDELCLNRTLGRMVRHWSIYLIGIVKHGWDKKAGDITLNIRKPKNFVFDPEGYIDVKGSFVGEYLGERISCSAKKLIKMFPKFKEYIVIKTNGKLGTTVTRTEWWNDDFCFTTFGDKVLEKHRNEFYNYSKEEEGLDENDEEIKTETPGINHLSHPQMPYTFLSVFSMEEQPHDITNLIEQNISNQNRIIDRDMQVDKNLRSGNNSIVVSGVSFNEETAKQAASAAEDGDPILVPDGRVDDAIKRIPANALPSGIIESQQIAKDTLRGVFGVQGTGSQPMKSSDTARGMILNQSHDTARTGGGIGDALEQVANSIFNFQLQMYYVFYDEPHYAAIMGSGRAVNYVQLLMSNQKRHFVVSVSPDSMKPKDEISEMNEAIELWNNKALDPITLFKKLNDPDPMETAKMAALWLTNPQAYIQTFFPENAMPDSANPPNPLTIPPEQGTPETNLGAPPASPALSTVPINAGVAQP